MKKSGLECWNSVWELIFGLQMRLQFISMYVVVLFSKVKLKPHSLAHYKNLCIIFESFEETGLSLFKQWEILFKKSLNFYLTQPST